jgi:hypothetical protein
MICFEFKALSQKFYIWPRALLEKNIFSSYTPLSLIYKEKHSSHKAKVPKPAPTIAGESARA